MTQSPTAVSPVASADSRPSLPAARAGVRPVDSQQLLQGRRELWITHGDQLYRLRATSNGKLYLSK